MTPDQADEFLNCAEKGLTVISNDIASHHETYTIFNREYPWAPSCKEFDEYAWVNAHLKTGEKETVQVSDYSSFAAFLQRYRGMTEDDENVSYDVELMGEDGDDIFPVSEIKYKEETKPSNHRALFDSKCILCASYMFSVKKTNFQIFMLLFIFLFCVESVDEMEHDVASEDVGDALIP